MCVIVATCEYITFQSAVISALPTQDVSIYISSLSTEESLNRTFELQEFNITEIYIVYNVDEDGLDFKSVC